MHINIRNRTKFLLLPTSCICLGDSARKVLLFLLACSFLFGIFVGTFLSLRRHAQHEDQTRGSWFDITFCSVKHNTSQWKIPTIKNTAIVTSVTGGYARRIQIDVWVESIRTKLNWRGHIVVITDEPKCFSLGEREEGVSRFVSQLQEGEGSTFFHVVDVTATQMYKDIMLEQYSKMRIAKLVKLYSLHIALNMLPQLSQFAWVDSDIIFSRPCLQELFVPLENNNITKTVAVPPFAFFPAKLGSPKGPFNSGITLFHKVHSAFLWKEWFTQLTKERSLSSDQIALRHVLYKNDQNKVNDSIIVLPQELYVSWNEEKLFQFGELSNTAEQNEYTKSFCVHHFTAKRRTLALQKHWAPKMDKVFKWLNFTSIEHAVNRRDVAEEHRTSPRIWIYDHKLFPCKT